MQAYQCDDCNALVSGSAPTVDGGEPREVDVEVKMQDFQVKSMDTLVVRIRVGRWPGPNGGKCPLVDLCAACRARAVLEAGLILASQAGIAGDLLVGVKRAVEALPSKAGKRHG